MMNDLFRGVRLVDREIQLHSGDFTSVFFDVEAMLATETARNFIVDDLVLRIRQAAPEPEKSEYRLGPTGRVDAVVGIESGGAVLAALVAVKLGVDFYVVRKDGTTTLPTAAEYTVAHRRPEFDTLHAALVDDVITTGNSAREAVAIVGRQGWLALGPFCVVDRRLLGQDTIDE